MGQFISEGQTGTDHAYSISPPSGSSPVKLQAMRSEPILSNSPPSYINFKDASPSDHTAKTTKNKVSRRGAISLHHGDTPPPPSEIAPARPGASKMIPGMQKQPGINTINKGRQGLRPTNAKVNELLPSSYEDLPSTFGDSNLLPSNFEDPTQLPSTFVMPCKKGTKNPRSVTGTNFWDN